jgi:glycosyltransferase involved in cell wall biosynthesis
VNRPIHVIPLGVNPDYFNPGIRSYKPTSRYTFLSVFEWGERKGPEVLLRAYTDTFSESDDVLLLLKITNTDGGVDVARQIADMGLRRTGAPICLLYNQRLPGHQFGALYRSADCFVLPTRGEGWCMPAMEAMACGLPTIVTDWSAQHDFVTDKIAYPVRVAKLIPARAKCPYYEGFRWAEPDGEHLRHLMRYVYDHRAEAAEAGARASREVLEKWTWDQAAHRIVERLRTVSG